MSLLLSFGCLQSLEIPWRELDAMVLFKVIVVHSRSFAIIHSDFILHPLGLVNHIKALIRGTQFWSDMLLASFCFIPHQITNVVFFLMNLPVKEGLPLL